jgi:hypothetical protein
VSSSAEEIRFGGSVSVNFSHQVTHEGKTHSYAWNQDGPNADWARKGLCRVGIRNGKFIVLFPGPPTALSRSFSPVRLVLLVQLESPLFPRKGRLVVSPEFNHLLLPPDRFLEVPTLGVTGSKGAQGVSIFPP